MVPLLPRILLCTCSQGKVLSGRSLAVVTAALEKSSRDFQVVPDLCEMAARKDPRLKEIAGGPLKVIACFPRAVNWLFAAAGADLAKGQTEVINLRTREPLEALASALAEGINPERESSQSLDSRPVAGRRTSLMETADLVSVSKAPSNGRWLPWFPVIDFERCTHCMQCLNFCLFGVFGVDDQRRVKVEKAESCKTYCPACSRVCPEAAIMFPKYSTGPINGDRVTQADLSREHMKADLSSLLGGDLYQVLRARTKRGSERFSRERDPDQALEERRRCLEMAARISGMSPSEIERLASLPVGEPSAAAALESAPTSQ